MVVADNIDIVIADPLAHSYAHISLKVALSVFLYSVHIMADFTLFFDESHLNSRGATRFTRTLIPQIKPYL